MIAAAVLTAGIALVASPQRVAVAPGAHSAVTVRNFGLRPVAVDVGVARYRLDLHGRPLVGGASRGWVRAAPARVVLPPRGARTVDLVAPRQARASPGDHSVLVTLTGATGTRGTRIVLRLGVVVTVRVPGRLVRRLIVGRLRTLDMGGRRVLELAVRNTGNVDLWLRRATVVARRAGARRGVWDVRGRRILAGGNAVFRWAVPPRLVRRIVAADVVVGATGARAHRRFHLRL